MEKLKVESSFSRLAALVKASQSDERKDGRMKREKRKEKSGYITRGRISYRLLYMSMEGGDMKMLT